MSGVWGAGGPRCQEALAVLASLCRARPPPLGLDVETCRSFELQPPERSPSAAGAAVLDALEEQGGLQSLFC
ncbi:SYT6 isoform 4 [Pan troglodytes]|uniref:Synaptotagmin 6 n=2 Tax=Homininae TaxID=207598 RepID=V9GYB1_HUMAN|nr:synaptotagmin 6 [Homo sapiens]PNI25550.1 SYT6 isoform 2 [Pan troglodytes]KAI2518536.1 synaptotagmin 6 [Homo sapiens]KAI4082072.1 synaptotagmin 6 [Homo sapiens]KAI4082078.1 synaptotagmin 6 [Homo sapiens]